MNVYPKYKLRLPYRGEAHVLQLLQAIPDDFSFAIHSLNLPNHEYKRWGEADFVIVSPTGITVLEVKGGAVSYVERVWRYYNAREEFVESREGPVRQVQSASLAVEKMILDILGRSVACRWGVVFPYCRFTLNLPDLPPSRLADLSVCCDTPTFSKWLDMIPYHPKDPGSYALTVQEVEHVCQHLVPKFHATESVGLKIACHRVRSLELTRQQIDILDSVEMHPRLLVQGGAGTGKTEVAVAVARAERIAGYRPVLVCPNEVAVSWMRDRLSEYGVVVVTQAPPEETDFDCLIVDEGQDFCHLDSLKWLFNGLPGGLENGRWRWFMDKNLQFLVHPPHPDALARLRAYGFEVTLKKNVRNTREIIDCVRAFLQADVGLASVEGYGVRVTLRNLPLARPEWQQALLELEGLMASGVLAADIAVLGPAGLNGPTCHELALQVPELLAPISDSNGGSRGVIASLAQFRGLEAACVILVDMDLLPKGRSSEALLYIGMTRAVTCLTLLVSNCFKEWLGQLLCRD